MTPIWALKVAANFTAICVLFWKRPSKSRLLWLAMGETILQKLGLTLACVTCLQSGLKTGAVLQGANDPSDPVLTVTCGCRRLQWRQRAEA